MPLAESRSSSPKKPLVQTGGKAASSAGKTTPISLAKAVPITGYSSRPGAPLTNRFASNQANKASDTRSQAVAQNRATQARADDTRNQATTQHRSTNAYAAQQKADQTRQFGASYSKYATKRKEDLAGPTPPPPALGRGKGEGLDPPGRVATGWNPDKMKVEKGDRRSGRGGGELKVDHGQNHKLFNLTNPTPSQLKSMLNNKQERKFAGHVADIDKARSDFEMGTRKVDALFSQLQQTKDPVEAQKLQGAYNQARDEQMRLRLAMNREQQQLDDYGRKVKQKIGLSGGNITVNEQNKVVFVPKDPGSTQDLTHDQRIRKVMTNMEKGETNLARLQARGSALQQQIASTTDPAQREQLMGQYRLVRDREDEVRVRQANREHKLARLESKRGGLIVDDQGSSFGQVGISTLSSGGATGSNNKKNNGVLQPPEGRPNMGAVSGPAGANPGTSPTEGGGLTYSVTPSVYEGPNPFEGDGRGGNKGKKHKNKDKVAAAGTSTISAVKPPKHITPYVEQPQPGVMPAAGSITPVRPNIAPVRPTPFVEQPQPGVMPAAGSITPVSGGVAQPIPAHHGPKNIQIEKKRRDDDDRPKDSVIRMGGVAGGGKNESLPGGNVKITAMGGGGPGRRAATNR